MTAPIRILHLEDDPLDAELVRIQLRKDQVECEIVRASSREPFLAAINSGGIDLILSDHSLPDIDGPEAIRLAQSMAHDVPVIIVSGMLGEEAAVDIMRIGATDYVLKQRLARLAPAVRRVAGELEERRARQSAEGALVESEDRFRTLADTTPVIIWMTDLAGACTYVNQAWSRLTGRTPQQESGNGWLRSIREVDRAVLADRLNAAVSSGSEFVVELQVRRHDGKPRWLLTQGGPRTLPDGRCLGVIGVAFDITDRRRLESQLQAARHAAEAAHLAKSQFVANMSHELRTPLNAIIGIADTLLDEERPASDRAMLNVVRDSGEMLLTVLTSVLDFSAAETGKLGLNTTQFTLATELDLVRGPVRQAALSKGLDLQWDLRGDMPSQLVGDPERLCQVLFILLNNAVKFTERGLIRFAVETKQRALGVVQLEASIADTGPGIAKEKLSSIFEPFVQADNSDTREFGGTGLGLALASHLTRLMNGRLWVESQPMKGSTFHLSVPLKLARGRAGATTEPARKPVGSHSRSRSQN